MRSALLACLALSLAACGGAQQAAPSTSTQLPIVAESDEQPQWLQGGASNEATLVMRTRVLVPGPDTHSCYTEVDGDATVVSATNSFTSTNGREAREVVFTYQVAPGPHRVELKIGERVLATLQITVSADGENIADFGELSADAH